MSSDLGINIKGMYDALEIARRLGVEIYNNLQTILGDVQLPEGYRILRHKTGVRDGDPYVSLHITMPNGRAYTSDVTEFDPFLRRNLEAVDRELHKLLSIHAVRFIPEEIPLEEPSGDYLDP